MEMGFSVLGSGSKGNSILFSSPETTFLVDAGLSARQIKLRMNKVGKDPCQLDFVMVTHEHSDHVRGIPQLIKRYGIKIVANMATYRAMLPILRGSPEHISFITGEEFTMGDIRIRPLPISHDAVEPVSFIIRMGNLKMAVMTDLGFVPEELLHQLDDLDLFVLEANHDMDMLMGGPYPLFLKRRISSLTGHLSNSVAAETLLQTIPKTGSHVFLAHISETNNHPDFAFSSVRERMADLGGGIGQLHLTYQDRPTELFRFPL